SVSQTVVEEFDRVSKTALTNANDELIGVYLTSTITSAKVEAALQKAQTQKMKLGQTETDIAEVGKQIKAIAEDQTRIRANMERVPQDSAPYQRYLKKLDEQETQIETLQERTKTLRRQEEQQRREYEA